MQAKLTQILLFIFTLLLVNKVSANLDDLNLFYQEADTQQSMAWPMLPNESLAELAAKFYPNNKLMQRKFILKTKRLNKSSQADLSANTRFKELKAITIPNLKSLSISAGVIKRSNKQPSNKSLQLSYNIKSNAEKITSTIKNIPTRLIQQYEELVVRNTFLKEEIAKLNTRLVFLKNKLGELTLIMDRSLTLPSKKVLKNLDVEKNKIKNEDKAKIIAKIKKVTKNEVATKPKQASQKSFFDLSNKWLWLSIFGLGFLMVAGSGLLKKYRERKYLKLVNTISRQNQATQFDIVEAEANTIQERPISASTTVNNDVTVGDNNRHSVLQEAKAMVAKNAREEAIGHLKQAVRGKSKSDISIWLYLLETLKKQGLKHDFEKFALEAHKNFNVMTPLWEEHAVALVVLQSLEDFPHIMKFLTEQWPNENTIAYLKKLIVDNRSGERSGFSQPVMEEVLLLISVLETREIA